MKIVLQIIDLNQTQYRLECYEWSDVVDGVAYCPCCQADKATGHSGWCCLYGEQPESEAAG